MADTKPDPKEKTSTLVTSVEKLTKTNEDAAKDANQLAEDTIQYTKSNTQAIIDSKVAAGIMAQEQKKLDAGIAAKVDARLVEFQEGDESKSFKGLYNRMGKSIKATLMMDKSFAEGIGEIGTAIGQDMAFLGQMLSPLTAIPGVSTAMTALKFIGGNMLKLLTVEGRRNAKRWLLEKKRWLWEKMQAAKNKIMNRGRVLKKDGTPDMRFKKRKNNLLQLFTKLFRGVAIVIFGLIAFVMGFFKSIGGQLGKLFSGPWNKIKAVFAKFRPSWANSKSISKMFSGPWDKIKNAFKGIKLPPGVTTAMNTIKNFFGNAKGGISNAFTKIRGWLKPAGDAIRKMMNSPIVRFAGNLGKNLGKLAWPITLLMGVWASVTGWIEGWKNTEGGIWGKLTGALSGGVEKLLNFFIFGFMDFLKDIVRWVGQKLGFISDDMAGKIDEFSFVEIFSRMWEGLVNIGLGIQNWLSAVLAGAWAAVKAAWPGGETPKGAFQKAYSAQMAAGPAVYKSQDLMDIDAERIEEEAEKNKRLEDKNNHDAQNGSGDTNLASQKTEIFNAGNKTIKVQTEGPSDAYGGGMAGAYGY